jgi:hypothetical protein
MCGEVPIGPDVTCSRCGKRLLMCPSRAIVPEPLSQEEPRDALSAEESNLAEAGGQRGQLDLVEDIAPMLQPICDQPSVRQWLRLTETLRDELTAQAELEHQQAQEMAQQSTETRRAAETLDRLLTILPAIAEWNEVPDPPQLQRAAPSSRWSRLNERCVRCGTTERPHRSKGLCERCYFQVRRGATPTDTM